MKATLPVWWLHLVITSVVLGQSPAAIRTDRLERIDRVVEEGIHRKQMPGCVVVIGSRNEIYFEKAYGQRQLQPEPVPMTLATVFDLASLTKPIATGTSIMQLAEHGKIDLTASVSTYLPEFTGSGKEKITVTQLLTHQGGLIPDNALADYQRGRKIAYQKINELTLRAEPGTEFIYSDVSFIVLGELVERITGQRLDEYAQEQIFKPLQMADSGYLPGAQLRERAAPTQEREDRWMRGEVHDPRAYEMDGVAGHAGLFSTAADLTRFARMILNRGKLDGVQVLDSKTVEQITAPVTVSGGVRSLGWDKQTGYSSNKGDLLSDQAIGHGGFTGTGLWIDPELDLFIIFLSNRVHPDGSGSVNSLIGRIATISAAALP